MPALPRPRPFRSLVSQRALLIGLAFAGAGCATWGSVPGTAQDLPHLIKVDDGLYRGAQPSLAGFEQLSRMGVKTVINLRRPSRRMARERARAEALGMRWVPLPIWAWWRPSPAQIEQFLAIATDPAARPVFVHCRLGKNRTGMMAAIYRIVHQGWTPAQAYQEGRRLGLTPWNLVTREVIFHEIPRAYPSRPNALADVAAR